MKKLVSVVCGLMMVGVLYGTSFATCNGPGCGSTINGSVDVDSDAYGAGISVDGKILGIGVGSYTENFATTSADVNVSVDPNTNGYGVAGGGIYGDVDQSSLNGSIVGSSPRHDWDTDGFSGGIAGQGSVGGFVGGSFAMSGPDYGGRCYSVDSYAGGYVEAGIDMNGYSESNSYRFIDYDHGSKTEGMGTSVEAGTSVNSYGYSSDYDRGLGYGTAGVEGSYKTLGGTSTTTFQSNNGGIAGANAIGGYSGSGVLNTQYNGSASGYSRTSLTTVNGMNGTISSSSAGMSVTSNGSGNILK